MKHKLKYIEENLFGSWQPTGTAQENYDGFISEYEIEGLTDDRGDEITVADIQEYFDAIAKEKYPIENITQM